MPEASITMPTLAARAHWEELLRMDLVYVERRARCMAIRAAFTKLRGVGYCMRELNFGRVAGHTGCRHRWCGGFKTLRRDYVLQTVREIRFRSVHVAHAAVLNVPHPARRAERREGHI